MAKTNVLYCSLDWTRIFELIDAHLMDAELRRCPRQDVLDYTGDAEVLIPTLCPITSKVLDAAPKVRLIQQCGVGVEGIDIGAATERGIAVANVPSAVSRIDAVVAEVAVMHTLMLARRYKESVAELRAGRWGGPMGTSLLGQTAGIIGLGHIGRAVAKRLRGFEMRIMGLVREVDRDPAVREDVDWLGDRSQLDELLAESDLVILCPTLNSSNRQMIGRSQLAKMKRTAYLINIARGALVDEQALEEALRDHVIAGAGLDVFDQEPVDPEASLFRYNVTATPHIGGLTELAYRGASRAVAENVRRLRAGEPLLNCVNAAALLQR